MANEQFNIVTHLLKFNFTFLKNAPNKVMAQKENKLVMGAWLIKQNILMSIKLRILFYTGTGT